MTDHEEIEKLRAAHTAEAIRERFREGYRQSSLRDMIYGAIDGTVTTFAVVSGVAGAGLSIAIVIIMGAANLIADGFSMAVSNFLGTRADIQMRERARKMEEMHVEKIPEGEQEEVREIFRRKGFEGELLERIVEVIVAKKERWVELMVTEEHGYLPEMPSPLKAAAATFVSFIAAGLIPLLPFLWQAAGGALPGDAFAISAVMTMAAFFAVGAVKARFVEKPWLVSGLETLLMGGCAAALAYGIGVLLKGLA